MSDERLVSEELKTGSLEPTEGLIRQRAFQLYEERGCEDGHELDDWLQAEAEMYGKKPSESTIASRKKASRTVAA